jgi:hypothetical protein
MVAVALLVSVALAPARAQQPIPPPVPPPVPQPIPQPPPPTPVPIPMPPPAPVPMPPVTVVAPPPPQPIMGYRAPAIALVQPVAGQSLPQDKAVIILRFAVGEPSDQLDASSFGVWVNGANRAALFQVAGTEAWGPLSDPRSGPLAPGVYQVTARICSTRGTCGTTAATVTVTASDVGTAKADDAASRKQRLIDLLLAGLRRLVGP